MKKSMIILLVVASTFILASYTVLKTSGSHPGSTGAPGDLTCAQSGCHTTASITQDSGLVNTLLFTSIDTTYTPGTNYTLTLQVAKPNISKFGFELVALKDSTNTNIGNFTVIESTRTQKINHLAGGGDLRFSMTHKTAGTTTSTPGSTQWKMRWTAPPTNVGTITFWYATNCTNNNGLNTGDQLFLSHFQIRPFVPLDTTSGDTTILTGVNKYSLDKKFVAYQETSTHSLLLKFTASKEENAMVKVYDISGKIILEEDLKVIAGENFQKVVLPNNCCDGAYFLKFYTEDKVYTKKIILE